MRTPKAKYARSADSGQVPRGNGEKHLVKGVKQRLNVYGGKSGGLGDCFPAITASERVLVAGSSYSTGGSHRLVVWRACVERAKERWPE